MDRRPECRVYFDPLPYRGRHRAGGPGPPPAVSGDGPDEPLAEDTAYTLEVDGIEGFGTTALDAPVQQSYRTGRRLVAPPSAVPPAFEEVYREVLAPLQQEKTLVLLVEDDGEGFDPQEVMRAGDEQCLGLMGTQERAALVHGELRIESAPGKGTPVKVTVPHAREMDDDSNPDRG